MDLPSNPLADLTGYDLRHLALHLHMASRPEDLHHVLALETNVEANAWYEVKVAVTVHGPAGISEGIG